MKKDDPLLFVDAIEAGTARLLSGVDAFDLPARLLPAGTKEGSWLRLSFEPAPAPPDDGGALRRKLGRDDDGQAIKL
jgi:hypothetical protein